MILLLLQVAQPPWLGLWVAQRPVAAPLPASTAQQHRRLCATQLMLKVDIHQG